MCIRAYVLAGCDVILTWVFASSAASWCMCVCVCEREREREREPGTSLPSVEKTLMCRWVGGERREPLQL